MQTNAITSENTRKHLIMEMCFIVGLGTITAKEAEHVPQRARGQENRRPLIGRWAARQLRHGQICPIPTNSGHPADAQAHQHPWCWLSPKHPPHAAGLAAER